MATGLFQPERISTPVSLYLGLEEGRTADLEAVAQAALAWVQAIREMAFVVDPAVTVRIEIVDGEQGSLWLNTILAFFESGLERIEAGSAKYPRLRALARGLALIVVATPIAVTAEDIWRAVIEDDPQVVELSPEARARLLDDFKRAMNPNVAEQECKQFFRALETDNSVKCVGVSKGPSSPPTLITPRKSFEAYLAGTTSLELLDSNRKRVETWEVTLVSPVLENAERSWRFRRPGLPEFGAIMRDSDFLEAIELGEIHVELRQGIEMLVIVQFKEKLEGGVWVTKERSVLKVLKPTFERRQLSL